MGPARQSRAFFLFLDQGPSLACRLRASDAQHRNRPWAEFRRADPLRIGPGRRHLQLVRLGLHHAEYVEESVGLRGGEARLQSRGLKKRWIDAGHLIRSQSLQPLDQQRQQSLCDLGIGIIPLPVQFPIFQLAHYIHLGNAPFHLEAILPEFLRERSQLLGQPEHEFIPMLWVVGAAEKLDDSVEGKTGVRYWTNSFDCLIFLSW